ncbi:MAG: hypothetical protein AAF206_12860, partial [Bacteroidota bacterium]
PMPLTSPSDSTALTEAEKRVWQDVDFMPLKQKVWVKLEAVLVDFQESILSMPTSQSFRQKGAKLSRGENHYSYSYRVMDAIRQYEGEDLLLFRAVMLWGHPIGIHFICTGKWQARFDVEMLEGLGRNLISLRINSQANPWEWRFEDESMPLIQSRSKQEIEAILTQRDFLKLSLFLSTDQYQDLAGEGERMWTAIAYSLGI